MSGQRCRKHRTSSPSHAEPDARQLRESARPTAAEDRTTLRLLGSGARRLPSRVICNGPTGGRHLASFDEKFSILNFVAVLEQAALGRNRGAATVLVIWSAVTGTHEQTRLWKPANRTSEVRAVDGKVLESLIVDVSDPACYISRFASRGIHDRVSIGDETSMANRELFQPAEGKP